MLWAMTTLRVIDLFCEEGRSDPERKYGYGETSLRLKPKIGRVEGFGRTPIYEDADLCWERLATPLHTSVGLLVRELALSICA